MMSVLSPSPTIACLSLLALAGDIPSCTVKRPGRRLRGYALPPHRPKLGVGRNDPCPCGSGKKFKKCHLVALGI